LLPAAAAVAAMPLAALVVVAAAVTLNLQTFLSLVLLTL
jgi:hypothetical protein